MARAARRAGDSKTSGAARGSREAFVATTASLLRRQGYAASGLNEIVARSGAPKGSLYFHFPGGKEELAIAAMRSAGGALEGAIETVLGAHEDAADAICALIDAMAAGLAASGFRDGCPIATVTLEAASSSPAIREAAAGVFESWTAAIERRLRAAGVSRRTARSRAVLVLAALEGALVLARAEGDVGPLLDVRRELRALL